MCVISRNIFNFFILNYMSFFGFGNNIVGHERALAGVYLSLHNFSLSICKFIYVLYYGC